MSYYCEVGISFKTDAWEFLKCNYRDAWEFLSTANTQYMRDAGRLYIWRCLDWKNDSLLHEAIDALKCDDYFLLVIGENWDDIYEAGEFNLFNMCVERRIDYEDSFECGFKRDAKRRAGG